MGSVPFIREKAPCTRLNNRWLVLGGAHREAGGIALVVVEAARGVDKFMGLGVVSRDPTEGATSAEASWLWSVKTELGHKGVGWLFCLSLILKIILLSDLSLKSLSPQLYLDIQPMVFFPDLVTFICRG